MRTRLHAYLLAAAVIAASCYRRCDCPCCRGGAGGGVVQAQVQARARVQLNCWEVCNNFSRTCSQSCSLHGPTADPCGCGTVWLDCMASCRDNRPINTLPSR